MENVGIGKAMIARLKNGEDLKEVLKLLEKIVENSDDGDRARAFKATLGKIQAAAAEGSIDEATEMAIALIKNNNAVLKNSKEAKEHKTKVEEDETTEARRKFLLTAGIGAVIGICFYRRFFERRI